MRRREVYLWVLGGVILVIVAVGCLCYGLGYRNAQRDTEKILWGERR